MVCAYRDGNFVRELSYLPLALDIPVAFNSCRKGPRGLEWRSDKPAELAWMEAQVRMYIESGFHTWVMVRGRTAPCICPSTTSIYLSAFDGVIEQCPAPMTGRGRPSKRCVAP